MEIKFLNEQIKPLNENEIDLIKTKKKHIKVLATGIVGMTGMKIVSNLNFGVAVKTVGAALGGSSIGFMGAFAIPNYFLISLLLLCGSSVYASYKGVKPTRKGK